MKYMFILLLCGVCQAYDPYAVDMYCKVLSNGQRYSYLPDLYGCGGHWNCDNDNGAYIMCGLGTLWDQKRVTCDHTNNVDCKAQVEEFYNTNAKTVYEKYPGVCNILPTDQEIGDTPEANNTLTISQAVNNDTIMLDTSRSVDKAGYLVSFFYRAHGSEDVSFQIWRPVSGKYELIYKTDVSKTLTTGTAAYGQVNVDQPVQVHKGDIIGVMIPAGTNPLYSISKPCTDILYYDIPNSQQPAVHDVLQFAPFTDPDDCVSYSVGALVDTGTDKTASCRRLIASREPQVFYPYTDKESDDTSCWAIRSAGEGNILVVTVNNTIWPTDCITNSLHISEKGPGNTERSITLLCGSSDAIVTYTTMAYLFIELGANTNYTDMGQDIGIEYYYYRNRASPCYPTNDTFTTDAQTTEQTTEPTTEQTTEQTTEPTTEPTTEQTTFLPTTDSDYQSTTERDDSSEEDDTTITASTTSTTSTTTSTTTTKSPSTSSTTTTTRRTPDTNVRTTRRTKPPDLSTTTAPTRSSTNVDKQTGDEKLTPAALAGIGVGLLGLLALILIPLIIWLVKRKKKKVYDVNPEDDATSQFSARSDTQLLANGRPPPQINPLIINSANLGPPPNHLPPLKMNPIVNQDGGIGGIGGDPLSSLRTKLPSVRS